MTLRNPSVLTIECTFRYTGEFRAKDSTFYIKASAENLQSCLLMCSEVTCAVVTFHGTDCLIAPKKDEILPDLDQDAGWQQYFREDCSARAIGDRLIPLSMVKVIAGVLGIQILMGVTRRDR